MSVCKLYILELCPIWSAVIPPTLLKFCFAWPALTPPTFLWRNGCKVQSALTITGRLHQWATCSLHAYWYIQQSGRCVKSMNAKNTKKSHIHKNADANITCDFRDGDISRSRSRLPHARPAAHTASHTHGHTVSSITARWLDHNYIMYYI